MLNRANHGKPFFPNIMYLQQNWRQTQALWVSCGGGGGSTDVWHSQHFTGNKVVPRSCCCPNHSHHRQYGNSIMSNAQQKQSVSKAKSNMNATFLLPDVTTANEERSQPTIHQTDREDNLSLTPASSVRPRQGSTSRFPWYFWTDAWCRRNGRPLQPRPCGPAWTPGCGERRHSRWRTSRLPPPGTQRAWTGAQSGMAWAAGMHCLSQKRLKLAMFCAF